MCVLWLLFAAFVGIQGGGTIELMTAVLLSQLWLIEGNIVQELKGDCCDDSSANGS